MSRTIRLEKEGTPGEVRSIQGERFDSAKSSRLVACVVLLPEDAEPIRALLQKLTLPDSEFFRNGVSANSQEPGQQPDMDSWLGHSEAAAYLGISTSTLYHYSCRAQIERRKLAGRLEYRRSALDEFKRVHTLPASCPSIRARIIPSAHSSGK
jgi:hypothetical protein